MASTTTQKRVQPSASTGTLPSIVVHPAPDVSLWEQLPKSSRDQLEDAALELSDKMGVKLAMQEVTPTDLIPMSMALARMSSLLCLIAQDPTCEKITDEMREAHLKDAKRKSEESQVLGEQTSKKPNAKTLATKMNMMKSDKSPYKIECRCAMALWFRILEQEVWEHFPAERRMEIMTAALQNAILAQITTEMDKTNLILELWMATPEERAEKEEKKKSSWKTSLPMRTSKTFVKEVMETAKKRWKVPGKVHFES